LKSGECPFISWSYLAENENQRAEAERELAEQRAQDDALQGYLDQMSQLMLDRKLLKAEPGDPVYTLAQARTSTIISSLDAEHNRSVARFLTDTGVTGAGETSISLLRRSDLPRAALTRADLFEADLYNANLPNAKLGSVNLIGADLIAANLKDASLSEADLSGAYLPMPTCATATCARPT
jgi:hypothetical protein